MRRNCILNIRHVTCSAAAAISVNLWIFLHCVDQIGLLVQFLGPFVQYLMTILRVHLIGEKRMKYPCWSKVLVFHLIEIKKEFILNAAFENNFANKLASKQFLLSTHHSCCQWFLDANQIFSMITFEPWLYKANSLRYYLASCPGTRLILWRETPKSANKQYPLIINAELHLG